MCSSAFPLSFDTPSLIVPHLLLQPSCRAPADPYVEHDLLVIALDLILLKRGVYRHLLFNRGTPPRKVDQTARGYDQRREQSTEDQLAEDRNREWVSVRPYLSF